MRKVVLYSLLSADGVAEDPDRFVLDFDAQMRENLARVIDTQDTVLLGRGSYDEWAGYWPGSSELPFAPFINGVEKYVVTSSALDPTWDGARAVSQPLDQFVGDLKARPGADIGVHGSISLATSMLTAGLVDELRLVVTPVLAGAGRRLLDGGDRRRLELLEAESTPSGALLLSYRVDKRI